MIARPRKNPGCAGIVIVAVATDHRHIAVAGKCHSVSLIHHRSNATASDQLAAGSSPNLARARENPCRALVVVIRRSSHQCGIAIRGERHRTAFGGGANRSAAYQLCALLGPDSTCPGKDPRRTDPVVIGCPAEDGCVSIGGERHRRTLVCFACRAAADQLGLLGPNAIHTCKYPGRAGSFVIAVATDQSRVAIRGKCYGTALKNTLSDGIGCPKLLTLLNPSFAGPREYPSRAPSVAVVRAALN